MGSQPDVQNQVGVSSRGVALKSSQSVASDPHNIHATVAPMAVSCQGGAYARGTALRGGCDAELVVFLNCFRSFGDQKTRCTETLGAMRALLESWGHHPGPGLTFQFSEPKATGVLQFWLMSADQENWMDVSLVPAFDVLGQPRSGVKPTPEVYSSLLSSGCRDGEHAACFTELRRDFVNTRPIKLKNLILLVKHWYRQVRPLGWAAGAALPPAYALELLTIFAWEQGCGKPGFSMAEGLRTVLRLVQQYRSLCVYWIVNYSIQDPALRAHLLSQLQKARPLILDPVDPTWNVGQGSWELLAREAAALESQVCLQSGDGTPVPPWDVMPALLHQTPAGDLDISKFLYRLVGSSDVHVYSNGTRWLIQLESGGGSSAKGTALQGRSDADLVVFLSCFRQFSEQGSHLAGVISEFRAQLEACQQKQKFDVKFEISNRKNPRVLSFSLTSQTLLDQSVDFDVLPAFDALGLQSQLWSPCPLQPWYLKKAFCLMTIGAPYLSGLRGHQRGLETPHPRLTLSQDFLYGQLRPGSRPDPQVYKDLIHSYSNAGEFSTCFTELQRDFISIRPTKLKSLIRLVKHW
ncbi:2'-5'-oligoadenylate synthase 3-like [Alexandromys fortis]|uniref:2'-5'-oligoadenylate synthase 3-like n=1 Tax=Alexandromys fortis TaxID=100897 RepID=UPI0021531ED9|nr:2'-5'-oligoadenylate synthase 3-like [Microtus fortis]